MLTGGLLASCVVVPCLFTTRLEAVFVVPKLVALWAVLALSLAVVAAGVLFSGRLPRGARLFVPVDVLVASFVVLNVAAWAFSTDRRQSLYGERLQYQGLLTVLLYVGFFYVARLSLTDARRMRLLALAIAVGATLVSGYALVQKAGLDPIWEGFLPDGRVFSSIGQANALAAYLVPAIPLSASLVFGTKAVWQGLVLTAVAAMIAALSLTLSRGGYLACPLMLVVLAVGWRQELRARMRHVSYGLALALVAAATIVAVAQPARATVAESWRRIVASTDFSTHFSARFHLDAWHVAARIAADHPVLGTGQETFPDIFPEYSHAVLPPDRASALDAFRVESPHNVYLGIAAGAGFPALAAYIGIIAAFVVAVWRAARAGPPELTIPLVAVLAAASGHLVTDAFMTADVTSTWLFWVLMGAGLALMSGSGSAASNRGDVEGEMRGRRSRRVRLPR